MRKLISVPSGIWSACWAAGRTGSGPLYQRLADALRAGLLAVSRTTVVAAYRILRRERRLESRRGSGTRAAGPATARRAARGERVVLSFSGGVGYLPHGLPSLRRAIARRMSESGVPTDENQILVTNGAQQAITLLAHLLAEPGSSVVVEIPPTLARLTPFAAAGARLLGIPVEQAPGPRTPLRQLLRSERPRLLYLMPTFQNPTGAVRPPSGSSWPRSPPSSRCS